jgi:hypothetical protein
MNGGAVHPIDGHISRCWLIWSMVGRTVVGLHISVGSWELRHSLRGSALQGSGSKYQNPDPAKAQTYNRLPMTSQVT